MTDPRVEVREVTEDSFKVSGRGRKPVESPLLPNVALALSNEGKGYGVAITATYPKSTIMQHLTRAAKDLNLAADGYKLRTSDKSKDEAWSHVAFKVVKVEAVKAEVTK